MDVSSVTNGAPSTAGIESTTSLGKDQFLKLLVAQLAHQDPLNPVDDKEFVSQLAQFSGLEQMVEMNQRLDLLGVSQTALANAQIADLIGKEVLVRGDAISITRGETVAPVELRMGAAAAGATIEITNDQGRVVRTLKTGALARGAASVPWDGCDDAGAPLPPGTYTIKATAKNAAGADVSVATEVRGLVTAVAFDNGYPELVVGSRRFRPADVIQVLGGAALPLPPADPGGSP
ncbi:MAG: flagellar hook assembly protein FlgD [Deltaproteobacteria bacterium]|nr:flagellar hook assembly protein FlgD [Deltaproteobacteria bacterium]